MGMWIHKGPVIVVTSGKESGFQVGGDLHVLSFIYIF